MQIFLDTADRKAIEALLPTGLINGITTNPTHLSKQGPDTRQVLTDICSMMGEYDVSIEVTEKSPEAVYKQALNIAEFAQNAVVKIPFAQEYLGTISKLVDEGVRINVTLVFTTLQALMVAKLGVCYISPFVGRLDDIGTNGIEVLGSICAMRNQYEFETEILAASIRHIMHWQQSLTVGADIITIPPTLFHQAMHHPLTESGIAQFDRDWKMLNKASLF